MDKLTLTIIALTVAALILNMPFGYLRTNHKRMSFMWLFYIHAPVPVIVAFRLLSGISYKYIPLFLAGAICGQFLGGKLNKKRIS
ncbi:MAG: hypothetical protein OEV59_01240 [Deltaproteobacteria bacterium]|nr:hypothetical protein [Deltaproteobacteria bacterium]